MLRFSSIVKIISVNPYVLVSAPRAKKIKANWKKPIPVLVRINGMPKKAWRINMMPKGGGSFYLYLHGDVRKASGTKVGDKVDVEVAFDESYKNGPMHPMPKKFSAALAKNPQAKKAWMSLAPSRKKEILRYFANLKSREAKERNIEKAMRVLSGSRERFIARSWNSKT